MSTRDLEGRLRALEDQQAIRDVLMRYARGVDRCDLDLLKPAYHEDAYDDHGFFKAMPGSSPSSCYPRGRRTSISPAM
jgi:proline racemase